jgi:hypothetical protein
MTIPEKYDKIITGIISGFLLPVIISFFTFLFAKGDPTLHEWMIRISLAGVETQIVSLCVFPNVFIFLIFNHFDMLRASRGVLGATIVWAVVVFLIKFFL